MTFDPALKSHEYIFHTQTEKRRERLQRKGRDRFHRSLDIASQHDPIPAAARGGVESDFRHIDKVCRGQFTISSENVLHVNDYHYLINILFL